MNNWRARWNYCYNRIYCKPWTLFTFIHLGQCAEWEKHPLKEIVFTDETHIIDNGSLVIYFNYSHPCWLSSLSFTKSKFLCLNLRYTTLPSKVHHKVVGESTEWASAGKIARVLVVQLEHFCVTSLNHADILSDIYLLYDYELRGPIAAFMHTPEQNSKSTVHFLTCFL